MEIICFPTCYGLQEVDILHQRRIKTSCNSVALFIHSLPDGELLFRGVEKASVRYEKCLEGRLCGKMMQVCWKLKPRIKAFSNEYIFFYDLFEYASYISMEIERQRFLKMLNHINKIRYCIRILGIFRISLSNIFFITK